MAGVGQTLANPNKLAQEWKKCMFIELHETEQLCFFYEMASRPIYAKAMKYLELSFCFNALSMLFLSCSGLIF